MVLQIDRLWRRWLAVVLLVSLVGCEVVNIPPPDGATTTPQVPAPSTIAAPPASVLLSEAIGLRAVGDWPLVGERLSLLLSTFPAAPEARAARYYLAERYAQEGNWPSAADLFRQVGEPTGPADSLALDAIFWLALCAEASGDWQGAIREYDRYLAYDSVLKPYVLLRQAAQYQAGGQLEAAATAYEQAAQSAINPGERAGAYEKAIALRTSLGQNEQAIALYEPLLLLAREPAYRAQLLAQAIDLARLLNRPDQARAWLLETVAQAPATAQAGSAVDTLLAASDPGLNAATAARVYFNLERYSEAVPLFESALSQTTVPSDTAELGRLRGLALRGLGDYGNALAALAAAGAADPNGRAGRQAQLDWAQTLGQSGDTAQAALAYRQFADTYPDDPLAPEALAREAILRERLGDTAGASQTRQELGRRHPDSQQAAVALHALGLEWYQAGNFAAAEEAWRVLSTSTDPYERSRGAFWAGRAARSNGNAELAAQYFTTAQAADFDSYYAARAADELGQTPTGTISLSNSLNETDYVNTLQWIASWPGQPAPPTTTLTLEPFAERAITLARLGLHQEAIGEWNALRDDAFDEPYRLLNGAWAAHQYNATYSSLSLASALARLPPPDAPPQPVALQRLLFPAPFTELVLAESANFSVDPRLMYALFRQESLFDPRATSWVGARGLAQVMPETGQGIAQNLGVNDFQLDSLYQPVVSVRFGAFYLGRRLQDMNGSIQAALAAYNGGLGNAQRWAGGSTVADPDLFAELIDFPETENYVKIVYGNYGVYRSIYSDK
jgi:soluble lytic murein transglycosylase